MDRRKFINLSGLGITSFRYLILSSQLYQQAVSNQLLHPHGMQD